MALAIIVQRQITGLQLTQILQYTKIALFYPITIQY